MRHQNGFQPVSARIDPIRGLLIGTIPLTHRRVAPHAHHPHEGSRSIFPEQGMYLAILLERVDHIAQ
jgi:hypothetical protein